MNEENKKVEVVENTEKTTENKPRKFDKRRPRNNNREAAQRSYCNSKKILWSTS